MNTFGVDGNEESQPSMLRGLLSNSDRTRTATTKVSSPKNEKWFVIYGFTTAHDDTDHIDEVHGIGCSDSVKATYAKGIKVNTCLSTTSNRGYIKVSCDKKKAILTHYLDHACNNVNPNLIPQEQLLGCRPAVVDVFASRGGTWLDDFDGESSTLRSLLFACTSSHSDEERLPLPMAYYTTSSYYSNSTCGAENLIGFHAIRNRVCITTGTYASSKYSFPKHTRFSPSRICTGESFEAPNLFSTNCSAFVANQALSNNGHRIGDVSFPFVSSSLIGGKLSIESIMSTSSDDLDNHFILISLLVAASLLVLTIFICYSQKRFRSHDSFTDDRVDTSLDISIRDNEGMEN